MSQHSLSSQTWEADTLVDVIQKFTGQRVPIDMMKEFVKEKISLAGSMGYSQFNELLLSLGYDRVTRDFFDFFTGDKGEISSIQALMEMSDGFRVKAMLRYGNVKFAFKKLSRKSHPQIKELLSPICSAKLEDFSGRHQPLINLAPIPRHKTQDLGYVVYAELNSERQELIAEGKPTDEIDRKLVSIEDVRKVGQRNLQTYLTFDHLDVYIATSMRDPHEFWLVSGFVEKLFASPSLVHLKLRWFDPTQCYCDNRIDKGLVEGLMLKRAKCTVYLAQESDTLGKDSELASTLAQGKPVIAYVPKLGPYEDFKKEAVGLVSELYPGKDLKTLLAKYLPVFFPRGAWEDQQIRRWLDDPQLVDLEKLFLLTYERAKAMYDDRANKLKEVHPLGLQVHLETGVANGVLVARTVDECAQLLHGIMLCDLQFEIEEPTSETPLTLLREKATKSVFRVVTEDELLTNTYWNFYREDAFD